MSIYYVAGIPYGQTDELYHFGRKGMKWGQNVFTTWAEYLQGKGLGGAANVARGAAKGLGRLNEYINGDNARSALGEAIRNRENVSQARSAYNRTLSGQVQNLRRNAGNAFNNARNQAGQAFNSARTQAGQAMSNARTAVSTAYADAAKKVGGAGRNIQQFYSEVMAKAQDQIRAGKQMVSTYGNQAMSSIQELGKKALEGPKNWLDGLMDRFRKKTPAVMDREETPTMKDQYRTRKSVESRSGKSHNDFARATGIGKVGKYDRPYTNEDVKAINEWQDKEHRESLAPNEAQRKNLKKKKALNAGRSRAESNGDNYVPNYQRVNAKRLPIGPDLPGWKNGKKIKR